MSPLETIELQRELSHEQLEKDRCPQAYQEISKLYRCKQKEGTCQDQMKFGFTTLYCRRELER
jgi:hypothetical protein